MMRRRLRFRLREEGRLRLRFRKSVLGFRNFLTSALTSTFLASTIILLPTITFAACFDDLPTVEMGGARIHIDKAIKHASELLQGGKKITLLDQETPKTKGLPDLKRKIDEIEDQTKDMLDHANEVIKAINGAMEASDITKESRGNGEEALSRINKAINHLRQALDSTRTAKATSDYNKAMEQTIGGLRHAMEARSLTEEGYSHIKKM